MAVETEIPGGPDEVLLSEFRAVAEASVLVPDDSTAGARRRYGPRTAERLARVLANDRSRQERGGAGGGAAPRMPLWRSAIWQLCHLVPAVDLAGGAAGRWEFFLGTGAVRAGSCRRYFAAAADAGRLRAGAALADDGVRVDDGGEGFLVRFGQMPLLVGVYEFLLSMDGGRHGPAVVAACDELAGGPVDTARLTTAANALAERLQGYLKAHLSSAGFEADFRAMLSFLNERAQGGVWRIDDAAILAFWQRHSSDDFRTYDKTFRRFFDFWQCIGAQQERAAVSRAVPVDAPFDVDGQSAAAIEPDDAAPAQAADAWQSPMAAFDDGPAADIRFFTGPERRRLEPLARFAPFARQLPRAYLRLSVFGEAQTAISQQLRRAAGAPLPDRMLACVTAVPYPERREDYARLLRHLERLLLATLHVALSSDHADGRAAVHAFVDVDPQRLFDLARDRDVLTLDQDALAELQERAREAFARVRRRGFEVAGTGDADRVEGFLGAAGALASLAGILRRQLDAVDGLATTGDGLDTLYMQDRALFASEFTRIYGDG